MKKLTFLTLVVFVLTLLSAPYAEAYLTTNQAEFTTKDSKTGVYLIAFEFGHEKYDIHIPLSAFRSTKANSSYISYSLVDNEKEQAKGDSVGLILSTARLQNGMYVVPKGKKMKFTLIAFYTPSALETESDFRLQVNHLPFSFDGVQKLQLNVSELDHYTTELLTLSK
jgi:hypothetical protein